MNIAETTAARPSHREEVGRRIKRIVGRLPVEKTIAALAPSSGGSPEEAVSAMFSEADTMLNLVLDIAEEHLDVAEARGWGDKVCELVFMTKQRLKLACSLHESLVSDLASSLNNDVPDSQVRPAAGAT